MRKCVAWVAALTLSLTAGVACNSEEKPADSAAAKPPPQQEPPKPQPMQIDSTQLAAFKPLPDNMALGKDMSQARVDLGRMLYYETRLSKNHDISCNSCHQLDNFGVDGQPTSPGHKGQRGDRNSPTTYNAAGHFVQFWDGRAADVEEQAKGPVLNPVEMAMASEAQVVDTLKSMPEYVTAFAAAFPGEAEPTTFANMAIAIGAFERGLVTPSRWDALLKGDQTALTEQEKQGFKTFLEAGCVTCHNGAYVGGSLYQKLGLVSPWPNLKDEGRSKISGNEADKYFFKVPSLRNVAKTGPWLHDGSVATLEEMVTLMARHQLGKELSPQQTTEIVTFLNALTGEPPAEYIKMPTLPASTPKTPKPQAG